jgi:putative spermidine/putrescine transport system permease protein
MGGRLMPGKRIPIRPKTWMMVAPAAVFLALFYLAPLAHVLILSVTEPQAGFGNFAQVLSSTHFYEVLGHTFKTALVVTLGALLLGYPVAYAAANGPAGYGATLLTIVALSFWTSFLVRTYAWMVVLGAHGPVAGVVQALGFGRPQLLFTNVSATVGMVHALLPFMIMSLYSVMTRIDRRLVSAGESLGATPTRAFFSIYLPLSAPGIINGATLVFITCLGFYAMPVILGSPREPMIAGMIGDQIEQMANFGYAAALALTLLSATAATFAVYNHFFGLHRLWADR